jgi:hypothetical protein
MGSILETAITEENLQKWQKEFLEKESKENL